MPPVHLFHIPVMGLAFSIDTPLKVARFGISSAVSIMDDELIESMRKYHSLQESIPFDPVNKDQPAYRSLRIRTYLDLLNRIIKRQLCRIRELPFEKGTEIYGYFEMLPENSALKRRFLEMQGLPAGEQRKLIEDELRLSVRAGSIDVNIMAKVDRKRNEADENSDALTALHGYASSSLESSSLIISAGYNPRLFSAIEKYPDFYPDPVASLKKKITLKVSDFRSARIQAGILAKKGLWVSEFRIESGLNCGGHAFPTDGMLMGPILEEFKDQRASLRKQLYKICNEALAKKEMSCFPDEPWQGVTVQGGIGSSAENHFLIDHFKVDGTGWGSPFLLVPEVTNVDEQTLNDLAAAGTEDFYLSHSSPLGVPFNNFRKSSSQKQRLDRIAKGRPGSPCYKKYLASDMEFTDAPICKASRAYQSKKIAQLKTQQVSEAEYRELFDQITEKECLCEGLGASALIAYNMPLSHQLSAVTICPGPNLAFFKDRYSLREMVDHIYGRRDLLKYSERPHMFINELLLYVKYFKDKLANASDAGAQEKYMNIFRLNLIKAIAYYRELFSKYEMFSSGDHSALSVCEAFLLSR